MVTARRTRRGLRDGCPCSALPERTDSVKKTAASAVRNTLDGIQLPGSSTEFILPQVLQKGLTTTKGMEAMGISRYSVKDYQILVPPEKGTVSLPC